MKRDEYLFLAIIYALIIGLGSAWPYLQNYLPVQKTGDRPPAAVRLPVSYPPAPGMKISVDQPANLKGVGNV